MRKLIVLILLINLSYLVSCSKELTFDETDLEAFYDALDTNNFTVDVTYDEMYDNRIIYKVHYILKVNKNMMLRETETTEYSTNMVDVITKTYTIKKDNKYYEYMYQTDESSYGTTPKLTYVLDEVTEAYFNKAIEYGKSFIADYFIGYHFDDKNKIFKNTNSTIKIQNNMVTVTNKETFSAKNIKAVYTHFGTTKIKTPSFVSKYKEDIIEY